MMKNKTVLTEDETGTEIFSSLRNSVTTNLGDNGGQVLKDGAQKCGGRTAKPTQGTVVKSNTFAKLL